MRRSKAELEKLAAEIDEAATKIAEDIERTVDRVFAEYPALLFFPRMTINTVVRIIMSLLQSGVPAGQVHEIASGDSILITVAGSVYSQITNDPKFGHDERRY